MSITFSGKEQQYTLNCSLNYILMIFKALTETAVHKKLNLVRVADKLSSVFGNSNSKLYNLWVNAQGNTKFKVNSIHSN